ncbi:MAG: hypothetical protein NT178_11545 [Proteobacteria bacterium]|nr:hypothetical protein [Pseudomonadota bacterium]
MPRPKLNIDPETVRKAEKELSKIKESKLSIQLKGIIAASSHPVHQIANPCPILFIHICSILRTFMRSILCPM